MAINQTIKRLLLSLFFRLLHMFQVPILTLIAQRSFPSFRAHAMEGIDSVYARSAVPTRLFGTVIHICKETQNIHIQSQCNSVKCCRHPLTLVTKLSSVARIAQTLESAVRLTHAAAMSAGRTRHQPDARSVAIIRSSWN